MKLVQDRKDNGNFASLRELVILKTVSGHGKSELDAEFTHPKNAIRRRSQLGGAVGTTQDCPTTGTGTGLEMVRYLNRQPLFGDQFVPTTPDLMGFTLVERQATYINPGYCDFGSYKSYVPFLS